MSLGFQSPFIACISMEVIWMKSVMWLWLRVGWGSTQTNAKELALRKGKKKVALEHSGLTTADSQLACTHISPIPAGGSSLNSGNRKSLNRGYTKKAVYFYHCLHQLRSLLTDWCSFFSIMSANRTLKVVPITMNSRRHVHLVARRRMTNENICVLKSAENIKHVWYPPSG